MVVIYFFYGLVFFTMALVIASQIRKNSSFVLAKPIWLLCGFGLFQAFAEWFKVAKLLNMYGINLLNITLLHLIDVLTIGVSFLFLLLFGTHLVIDSVGKYEKLKYLPLVLAFGWIFKFIVIDYLFFPVDNFKIWTANSIAWARYLLAFPGAMLVSVGLLLQLPALKRLDLKSAYYNCQGAAIAFALYGFFSGLITFPVNFWPGNILNTTSFLEITGWPIQFFRATLGLLMAFTIIKTISIINVEQQKRLEEADRLSVLMEERERFSRDLHDGIIQSIYGAGLIIDASQAMLKKDKLDNVSEHMDDAKRRLNNTISELRNYIKDLLKEKEVEGNLIDMLQSLINEFRGISVITIDLIDKLDRDMHLNQKEEKHVCHIVQEALFNIVKHSQATKAKIIVEEDDDSHLLIIRVLDNGSGFSLHKLQKSASLESRGLNNMKFRAQRLGGNLTINSTLGKGTEIVLSFNIAEDAS
jgi:signal transduction histidine kinase